MSRLVALRPDLEELSGYHSPQVDVEVRLNTNESPFPPPRGWREDLREALSRLEFHRYPDRSASALRAAVAEHHGVDPGEVFCANGSNEVLQSLLLAYGGPSRAAACFTPTYALHRHISALTGTPMVTGARAADFTVPMAVVEETIARARPVVVFLCSPNNPTGRAEPLELMAATARAAPGLVVVDEAYGQFSSTSALDLRAADASLRSRLVVVRTFSKTWAMAAVRLGYLIAEPEVVEACEQVSLPYHLSTVTQLAGRLALRYREDMEQRVATIVAERVRLTAGLARLAVDTWPSQANFLLFRPRHVPGHEVWSSLLERSVLVRDCSSWQGLEGCLRVSVGTVEENDRFLEALEEVLR